MLDAGCWMLDVGLTRFACRQAGATDSDSKATSSRLGNHRFSPKATSFSRRRQVSPGWLASIFRSLGHRRCLNPKFAAAGTFDPQKHREFHVQAAFQARCGEPIYGHREVCARPKFTPRPEPAWNRARQLEGGFTILHVNVCIDDVIAHREANFYKKLWPVSVVRDGESSIRYWGIRHGESAIRLALHGETTWTAIFGRLLDVTHGDTSGAPASRVPLRFSFHWKPHSLPSSCGQFR